MKHFDSESVRQLTPYPELIDAIRTFFRNGASAPPRHHHTIPQSSAIDATLLLMPAWQDEGSFGVKIVNVFPGNREIELPTVNGVYLLFDRSGQITATLEGSELTARRTAATSALASQYLSRPDSRSLLIVGTGRLAAELAIAHTLVRPIEKVRIWGRRLEAAKRLAAQVQSTASEEPQRDIEFEAVDRLEDAVAESDIISTATLASSPLVLGQWLTAGVHLDLVGAYRPDMREVDTAAIQLANHVFVDTREGALAEGGDLVIPMGEGVLKTEDIVAQLAELTRGFEWHRRTEDITVFKSVGASIEDLAAADLCWKNAENL